MGKGMVYRTLTRIVAALGLLLAGCSACAQPTIVWEVKNRFPLLADPDDLWKLEQNGRKFRAQPMLRNPAIVVPPTHWDAYRQRYDPALLDPDAIVSLDLEPATDAPACAWKVDGAALADTRCAGVVFSLPADRLVALVEVRTSAGSVAQANVEVRRKLIVSFGDSFASGEGVPDVEPGAALVPESADPYVSAPRRPANWWDQRCHRSLSAGPVQAAMELARRNRDAQIIFVSFACSGAEVFEGVLGPYAGRETYAQLLESLRKYQRALPETVVADSSLCPGTGEAPAGLDAEDAACLASGGRKRTRTRECDRRCISAATGLQFNDEKYAGSLPSQFNALIELLCPDKFNPFSLQIHECDGRLRRPVDAILLSVGGNDIGFGALIKYSVLHGNAFNLDGFRSRQHQAQSRLNERYDELNVAFGRYLPKEKAGAFRVYLTQYPDPTHRADKPESDDRCGAREAVTTFRERSFSSWWLDLFFLGISNNEIKETRERIVRPLQDAAVKVTAKHGWRLVDRHVQSFVRHGYCNRWQDESSWPWINNHHDALFRQEALVGAYDSAGGFASGAMHPNILGQSCYADAIVDALEADLFSGKAQPTVKSCYSEP